MKEKKERERKIGFKKKERKKKGKNRILWQSLSYTWVDRVKLKAGRQYTFTKDGLKVSNSSGEY